MLKNILEVFTYQSDEQQCFHSHHALFPVTVTILLCSHSHSHFFTCCCGSFLHVTSLPVSPKLPCMCKSASVMSPNLFTHGHSFCLHTFLSVLQISFTQKLHFFFKSNLHHFIC